MQTKEDDAISVTKLDSRVNEIKIQMETKLNALQKENEKFVELTKVISSYVQNESDPKSKDRGIAKDELISRLLSEEDALAASKVDLKEKILVQPSANGKVTPGPDTRLSSASLNLTISDVARKPVVHHTAELGELGDQSPNALNSSQSTPILSVNTNLPVIFPRLYTGKDDFSTPPGLDFLDSASIHEGEEKLPHSRMNVFAGPSPPHGSFNPHLRGVSPFQARSKDWTPVSSRIPASNTNGSPLGRPLHMDVRSLSKSGYLEKQGISFRSWKTRYFVLQNKNLFYFATKEDAEERRALPLGVIPLSSWFSVSKAEFCKSLIPSIVVKRDKMFIIETLERTFYLKASSESDLQEWVHILQEILRENQKDPHSDSFESVLAEGWLEKNTKGLTKRRWCVLKHNSLVYYKDSSDENVTPCGVIPISQGCEIELVPFSEKDSDDDLQDDVSISAENMLFSLANIDAMEKKKVIRFGLKTRESTHWFKCANERELEMWIYALLSLCPLSHVCRTKFEVLISTMASCIVDKHGDYNLEAEESLDYMDTVIQRDPIFRKGESSTDCLPLTSLPSERLVQEAYNIYKAIVIFSTTEVSPEKLEYHFGLVHALIESCLSNPMLQNELLLQLTKQTTVLELSDVDELIRTWQLFSLVLGIFMPVREAYQYVRLHLIRIMAHFDSEIVGEYAFYCLRLLLHAMEGEPTNQGRVVLISNRRFPPSKHEMRTVLLLKEPPPPMRVMVECMNGATFSVPFEPFTTVKQCKEVITSHLLLGKNEGTLPAKHFGLYLRTPNNTNNSNRLKRKPYNLELLSDESFIADAVYQHEQRKQQLEHEWVSRPHENNNLISFHANAAEVPFFIMKIRLFMPCITIPPRPSSSPKRNLIGSSILARSPPTPPPSPGSTMSSRCDNLSIKSLSVRSSSNPRFHEDKSLSKPFLLEKVDVVHNLAVLSPNDIENNDTVSVRVQAFLHKAQCTEKLFVAYQMNELVVGKLFPLTKSAAFTLCALLAQATYGDHYPLLERNERKYLVESVERFFPYNFRDSKIKKKFDITENGETISKVSSNWVNFRGMTQEEALNVYLSHTLTWPWGIWSKLYTCMLESSWWGKKNLEVIYLAVGWDGLCLLTKDKLEPLRMVAYKGIFYYGVTDEKVLMITVSPDSRQTSEIFSRSSSASSSPTVSVRNQPLRKALRHKLHNHFGRKGNEDNVDCFGERWKIMLTDPDASGPEVVERIKFHTNESYKG